MGRPKKGTSPYEPGSRRYFVRETIEMKGLMDMGRKQWPDESDGEIIRRYMSYGGRYLALTESVEQERKGVDKSP